MFLMENIFTSNWINRQVAVPMMLIVNFYTKEYDTAGECISETKKSLSNKANPLDRHTTLQMQYLLLIVLPWIIGAVVMIPSALFPNQEIRNSIGIVLFMIIIPMTVMAAYLSLRSWPARNEEAEWMANGYDDNIKAQPQNDYLNLDYFIAVPISLLIGWVVAHGIFS